MREQIASIDELSRFLHAWYGEPDGALALPDLEPAHDIATPLREFWSRLGGLLRGQEEWMRIGLPSPLACQDGLATPTGTRLEGGLVHFLFENQGNWTMAYSVDDRSPNPQVLCNAIELQVPGLGHVPIGATLSELLTTSALIETAHFCGERPFEDPLHRASHCGEPLWIGAYYNAPGVRGDDPPSHRFTANPDRTLLCATITGFDYPIIADRKIARERWRGPSS